MARLTQRNFRMLLDCIGEIYACHDLDSFTRRVIAMGRKAVRADWAACDEINLRRKRHRWITDPVDLDLSGPDPAVHEFFFTEHPFVLHLRRTGDVPPLRFSDLISRRQYRETTVYREAYRRFGVEYQLGFTLPSPSPGFSFGLAFNHARRDFSVEDRLFFRLLRPHLLQAYRNAELITQLREQVAGAAHAAEAATHGVVTLDARGRIRFCSTRARQSLADYFAWVDRANARLPGELQRWVRQQQLPATHNGSLAGPRQPFVAKREGRQLSIRLLTGSAPGEQTLMLEERRTELSAAPLQRLGLTARQGEVLLWIAQGKTTPEIGSILGISAGTAHKHTEHIFEKLGVETRTAAAGRAFEAMNQRGD